MLVVGQLGRLKGAVPLQRDQSGQLRRRDPGMGVPPDLPCQTHDGQPQPGGFIQIKRRSQLWANRGPATIRVWLPVC